VERDFRARLAAPFRPRWRQRGAVYPRGDVSSV